MLLYSFHWHVCVKVCYFNIVTCTCYWYGVHLFDFVLVCVVSDLDVLQCSILIIYIVNICLHCHTRHNDKGCNLLHLIHLAVHLLYTLFNTCHSQKKKTYVCTMKSMFNFFYKLLKMNLYMIGTDDDLCGLLFVRLYRFVMGNSFSDRLSYHILTCSASCLL